METLGWKSKGWWEIDRRISRKLKGKMLSSCVIPAYMYGLVTTAQTKKQQEKVQVYENKKNLTSEESW